MEENSHDVFRKLLSKLLEERQLSIRKLSIRSGVDHATISKIMNGKRKANLNHLQKLADSLDVELITLMKAAGYDVHSKYNEELDMQIAIEDIQKTMETSGVYNGRFTRKRLNQEVATYREYSQTDEGRQTIVNKFQEKIEKIASTGPHIQKLESMYSRFTKRKGTAYELALMGGALLYFIVTTDLLPDYLFPVGFLDDALVVQAIMQQLENKKL